MKSIGISSCITEPRRRGFNLIELAIVMGVVGIILGGIWSLAALSTESSRQTLAKTDITIIVKNVRAMFGSVNGIPTPGSSGTLISLTPFLANAAPSPIPGDMTRTGGGCALTRCVDHPWGPKTSLTVADGSLGICAWNPSTSVCSATTQQFFAVELDALPYGTCIQAATSNSGPDAPGGLIDIVVNGTSIMNAGTVSHMLPPKVSDLNKICTASSTVDFVYRLVAPLS